MPKLDRDKLGEWLTAYIDGELTADQRRQVEDLLREDQIARQLLDELRKTVETVASLPRHAAPSSILENLQMRVERDALLGDEEVPAAAPPTQRSAWPAFLATAAVLTLVVGGLWFLTGDNGPAVQRGREVVALAEKPKKETLEGINATRGSARSATRRRSDASDRRRRSAPLRVPEKRKPSRKSAVKSAGVAGAESTGPFGAKSNGQFSAKSTGVAAAKRKAGSASAIGAKAAANLLATASLEQKLRAGVALASLHSHRFRNEPVRLQVTARDRAQRDALTDRIITYLTKRHAANVAGVADKKSLENGTPEAFYYQGVPRENFTSAQDRQLLVRLPFRDVGGLLAELSRTDHQPQHVAFVSGPFRFEGLQRSREAVRSMHPAAEALASTTPVEPLESIGQSVAGLPNAAGAAAPRREQPSSSSVENPWSGLLKVIVPNPDPATAASKDARVSPNDGSVAMTPSNAPAPRSAASTPPAAFAPKSGAKRSPAAVDSANRGTTGTVRSGESPPGQRRSGHDAGPILPPKAVGSLVERRLAAARSSRRHVAAATRVHGARGRHRASTGSAARGKTASAFGGSPDTGSGDETYLTLVIQVRVADPSTPNKSRHERRSKPRPGSPPDAHDRAQR